jgi:hypothetical protein
MIVWPAKATPVRPDAYADCAAKIMRVVARASIEIARIKRSGGCDRPWPRLLLDHRSHTLTTWVMAIGLAVFLFG